MSDKQIFEKYYSRLALEGWLKSLALGLVVGFAASIIPALIAFLNNANGVLISLIVLVFVTGIATPIFFYTLLKPKTEQIAARVDRLGLEERAVTMLELENDESYIAMRQREDAKEKMAATDVRRLKISVLSLPIAVFVLLGVLAVASISMITVSALSVEDKKPYEQTEDWHPEAYDYVRVRFLVDNGIGGYIIGFADQLVVAGGDSSAVIAVADSGYMFSGWSDGITAAERNAIMVSLEHENEEGEIEILEELVFVASFKKVVEGDGEGEGKKDAPPSTSPPGEEIEREHIPDEAESTKAENQVENGEQYYKDEMYFQRQYELAMEYLAENGEIPDYLREILENYFNTIGA